MKQNVTFTVRRGEGTDETQSIHSAMFHKYVGMFQSQITRRFCANHEKIHIEPIEGVFLEP